MGLPHDIVAAVARRLAEHAGLELPAWVVAARAQVRCGLLGLAGGDYVELIASGRGAAELDELLEAVRVGETRLFRHRQQIAALEDVVAPALRARLREDRGPRNRELRVWSAGCAAGEEPYTLAAVLATAIPEAALSILATDVSSEALELARRASYPAAVLDHVPEAYRDDFVLDGDRLRVRPELARLVRFERANLIDSAPEGDFDIVWCRNVLIYFTAEAKQRAIQHLVGATKMGGVVFVGYSESLRDVAQLDPVRAGDAIYYVRGTRRLNLRTPPLGVSVPARAHAPSDAPRPVWREPTQPHLAVFVPETDVLALRGTPEPGTLTAELSAHLAAHVPRLAVDLDGAELLADELAPVFRRAIAAARAAGVTLELRATRTGARRWLARHKLPGGEEP